MRHVHQVLRSIAVFAVAGCGFSAVAAPLLSEIVASNKSTLADRDGDFSDWLEIYNPDPEPVDLTGWFLTDNANNRQKWQFPAVTLPPNGFLVVFASDKNRRDPGGELHTNFALSADGEYLGLIGPDGQSVVSEFAPAFPSQSADVAYGLVAGNANSPRYGFLSNPTPGTTNSSALVREQAQITPSTRTFVDSLQVTLEGASNGQVIRYELIAPSERGLDAPAPSDASSRYTGPITLTESTLVRAAVFAEDGSPGAVTSALFVKRSSAGAGATSTFSSRMPVVLLDDHGRGALTKSQGAIGAWLQLFAGAEDGAPVLEAVPTVATPIAVKVRGSTSADFPKKSYSLELRDSSGGSRASPLLGLANTADWALVSPWSYDPAYLRNAFTYALSNRIGRWAPRTQFVEVFFKTGGEALDQTHYAGISVLTERIKVASDLVAITPLQSSDLTAPNVTGGYILKFDTRDEDEYGWTTDRGFPAAEGTSAGTQLVIDTPKAAKLAPEQRDYIRGYVQDFENALFADRDSGWATRRYLDYIDRASWIDFHILQVLTKNSDGLARSAYFTKDRNGKLKAGPVWDVDRAMGSTDPRTERWDEWYEPTQGTPFWDTGWWGVLARDPDFMQAWIDRWQSLRAGAFSNENLAGLVTSLASRIDPDAAARDVARWPENVSRSPDGFPGEVDHLIGWITHRAQWIDQQLVARPVEIAGNARQIVAPAGMQIIYTLDGSDPRAPNGSIAPGAIIATGTLTLEGGTYTLRIYNPAAVGAYPSTPWSAVTVIESSGGSSPPTGGGVAAPQLINLATRGVIADGQGLVSGFVVGAGASKRFLIRAVGPTLRQFGVGESLSDPVLRVVSGGSTEVARNADWRTLPNRTELVAASAAVGAFGLSEEARDAAVIVTLPAGSYTLEITSEAGGRGVTLAEVYALDATSLVSNLSTRGLITPDAPLIGGVTVAGTESRRLLIRAIGPSLAKFGITNALPDPTLSVYTGATLLTSNDDWTFASNASDIASAAVATGAFALDPGSKDAAVLVRVQPGAYTLQVYGKDDTGVTLLEVYDAP